jgi:hypothetical protein
VNAVYTPVGIVLGLAAGHGSRHGWARSLAAGPAKTPGGRVMSARDGTGRADYRPTGTTTKTSLFATLKRTLTEFSEDNMTEGAPP